MDYKVLTEIDIILDEMKEWETELEAKWSNEQRMKYLNLKLDTFQSFLASQAEYWEKELSGGGSTEQQAEPEPSGPTQKEIEAAERQAAIQRAVSEKLAAEKARVAREEEERAAAQKLAAQKLAAEKLAAEKLAAEKLAAEKLAAEKAAAEKAAAEKAAAEKLAAQKLAAEKQRQAEAQQQPVQSKEALAESILAQKRAEVQSASGSSSDLSDHLEAERKDAIFRIGRPAGRQAADLTDPSVLDAYLRVRNDNDPLMWFILGYAANSQNKLVVQSSGSGDFDEMCGSLIEDAQFVYINYKFGDTQRSKFVFMSFVPDSLGGLKKSRVVGHRPPIEKLLKYIHLQWHILDKNELKKDVLEQKLLAIGGANYSVQEADKGDFSGYKQTTKEFYEEKDKNTQLSNLLYDKGPLARETPMDIGGRAMVATQSEFRSNIKELK